MERGAARTVAGSAADGPKPLAKKDRTARGGLFTGRDSTISCIAIKGLFGRQADSPLETDEAGETDKLDRPEPDASHRETADLSGVSEADAEALAARAASLATVNAALEAVAVAGEAAEVAANAQANMTSQNLYNQRQVRLAGFFIRINSSPLIRRDQEAFALIERVADCTCQ